MILSLHGAGERGAYGLIQTRVGLPVAVRFNVERWPAIMVMPQVAEDATWVGTFGDVALAAIDATETEYSTDVDRVCLTGLSMGEAGSWYLGVTTRRGTLVPSSILRSRSPNSLRP